MNMSTVLLSLISAVIILPMTDSIFTQTEESDKYMIKHIRTIEQNYGENYYSYNLAVIQLKTQ